METGGTTMTLTAPTADRRRADQAPPAKRSRPPGWRNPRLLLGLVLVAASVVLGARLMASADDTVPVWAVARDLPAGAAVSTDDLERRQLRFPDEATADAYLSADAPLPEGATLAREVAAGDLLPRSALSTGAGPALIHVPISVAADDLPASVREGSRVDVWVTPQVSAVEGAKLTAVRVLEDVAVIAVPAAADRLAPQATRQVIVGVPKERAATLGPAIGSMSDGRVVIARHG